jgi:hypothetical protein
VGWLREIVFDKVNLMLDEFRRDVCPYMLLSEKVSH